MGVWDLPWRARIRGWGGVEGEEGGGRERR